MKKVLNRVPLGDNIYTVMAHAARIRIRGGCRIQARKIVIGALLTVLCACCCARPAQAISYEDIPDDVLNVLPRFIFQIIDPQALAYLSAEDLREYANAYEAGTMHFIAESRVVDHSGPLDPQVALLILQIPQGAPYIEERFIRIAKQAYSRQTFASLTWQVWENKDGSVNIDVSYKSNSPQNFIPEPSNGGRSGALIGLRYNDFYYDKSNKSLSMNAGLPLDEADDVYGGVSFTDNTLNGGRNSQSVSASVANSWRTRERQTQGEASEVRTRVSRVDYAYGFNGAAPIGKKPGSWGIGAGFYRHEGYVYAGDPNGSGIAPRSDFSMTGNGLETYLTWNSGQRDSTYTPKEGWSYSARLSKTFGNFDSSRLRLDLRSYEPVANIFGQQKREDTKDGPGALNDIVDFYDTAGVAVQVQADLADGNVPWAYEVVGGGSNTVRGYTYDTFSDTKFLGGRAEYRCTIDRARHYEGFVFSDHGFIGESMDDLESINAWGLGTLFKFPIYGGFKIGAWMGQTYDGSDNTWGLAFGSQF